MGLNETLRAMKEAARGKLPPETRAIMAEALQAVEATGQHLKALPAGAQAPAFVLEDHAGRLWASAELL
jgi:hypothetical protein